MKATIIIEKEIEIPDEYISRGSFFAPPFLKNEGIWHYESQLDKNEKIVDIYDEDEYSLI